MPRPRPRVYSDCSHQPSLLQTGLGLGVRITGSQEQEGEAELHSCKHEFSTEIQYKAFKSPFRSLVNVF